MVLLATHISKKPLVRVQFTSRATFLQENATVTALWKLLLLKVLTPTWVYKVTKAAGDHRTSAFVLQPSPLSHLISSACRHVNYSEYESKNWWFLTYLIPSRREGTNGRVTEASYWMLFTVFFSRLLSWTPSHPGFQEKHSIPNLLPQRKRLSRKEKLYPGE